MDLIVALLLSLYQHAVYAIANASSLYLSLPTLPLSVSFRPSVHRFIIHLDESLLAELCCLVDIMRCNPSHSHYLVRNQANTFRQPDGPSLSPP